LLPNFGHEARNAAGERIRLPGAGTRDDQERTRRAPPAVQDGLALRGVEVRERVVLRGGDGAHDGGGERSFDRA